MPTAIITGITLIVAILGSVAAWWLNERVTVLEGGAPLMPRSEVIRGERRNGPEAEIFNYTCRSSRSAGLIKRFYRSYLENNGWQIDEEDVSAFQFKREDNTLRIVLHQQRLKTVFTIHMRHATSGET